jgi:hypothetical protein
MGEQGSHDRMEAGGAIPALAIDHTSVAARVFRVGAFRRAIALILVNSVCIRKHRKYL